MRKDARYPLAVFPLFVMVAGLSAALGQTSQPAGRSLRATAEVLPSAALTADLDHPLAAQIQAFLKNQDSAPGFRDSGLTMKDYLKVLEGQVGFFRKHQDATGAIIDPVEKIEWQYSTPCYTLSVALLASTGYNRDSGLLESGVRAMTCSVDEMAEYRTAHNHGEFFIQPVMLALDLYAKLVPAARLEDWKRKLASIDPYRLHPDNLRRKKTCYNHNVVALAGEFLRLRTSLFRDPEFLETHLEHQAAYMSPLGMYKDPKVPIVYDEFSRQFLASIMVEGYEGPRAGFYREKLWQGAWTSLFMLSPAGECPTGGRSAQHIWNEAQLAVTYEIYAAQYARQGRMNEAGAFKRAAHLALSSMQRWLKPDGTAYVVKNRFPPESKHGYEFYSAQSQYNLLACWLLAVAGLYADESIAERPCPAEVGGFVVPIPDFHKVFANAAGNYVEYETAGDLRYNPTGLIRCHLKGSNPQLGPSDGVVHQFDRQKQDLGGENLTIGPAWRDPAGGEHRLADYSPETPPNVEILEQTSARVQFRVVYAGSFDGAARISQAITIEPGGVTIEDALAGEGLKDMRVYYPMLVSDGLEETVVKPAGHCVSLAARNAGVRFCLLEPAGLELKRTGNHLKQRNGQVEATYADIPGLRAVYQIAPAER